MSKLTILALLFYNVAITLSFISERNAAPYDDRDDYTRFNLLNLPRNLPIKSRQIDEDTEPPYLKHWTGRWMPRNPDEPTPPPKVLPAVEAESMHNLPMGKVEECDDGETNLEVDWDNSAVNYTCYAGFIEPEKSIRPILYSETVPYAYSAGHKCMNETIEYSDEIPLYGNHRPVYPVYGEYKFLPKQRWLHSLEHGAVVMLYHPCANPEEVKLLKKIVMKCLRRHIISPYTLLDDDRPLALLTWGSRLTMSYVNPTIVRDYMREKALQGPEKIPHDGDFKEALLNKSQIVSDFKDSIICPKM